MILGYVAAASPFVPVTVTFQAINARRSELQFLLDTGASVSVLHPMDARSIGIDPSGDLGGVVEVNVGVGGAVPASRVMSWLEFTHVDGTLSRYRFALRIAKANAANETLPSILGMDFIRHFRLTLSVREDRVELEPLFDGA